MHCQWKYFVVWKIDGLGLPLIIGKLMKTVYWMEINLSKLLYKAIWHLIISIFRVNLVSCSKIWSSANHVNLNLFKWRLFFHFANLGRFSTILSIKALKMYILNRKFRFPHVHWNFTSRLLMGMAKNYITPVLAYPSVWKS